MIPVFPGVESGDNGSVGASDMVGLVLGTMEVNRLVVSSGDNVP